MIDVLYSLVKENLRLANMDNFGLVFADQNMPRMVKPYIVISLLNIDVPDHVIYDREIDANGIRNIYGWRKAIVELQIHNGLQSLESASRLALCLQSENSLLEQQRLDCAIGQRLFLSYVPMLINQSQYEGRAIYHFEFLYTETYADDVGLIETVIVHGEYSGTATDDIVCDETITYTIEVQPISKESNP